MSVLRLMSWNMQHKAENWETVITSDVDVALLQEAKHPPAHLLRKIALDISEGHPAFGLSWRAAVVGLSNRIMFTPIQTQPIGGDNREALMVSRMGTLALAIVKIRETGEEIVVVSMYSYWANPIGYTKSNWIYADASAHRLLSDISALIGRQTDHKIICTGDLNLLYGYGENNSQYWAERYATVFNRAAALGLQFIGPQAPEGGQQACPWPAELPTSSRNVPTFRTKINRPETANRQLDFVFASRSIADRVSVRAANSPDEWGPSDHCRIFVDLHA